jgi:two-component system, NarL family, sensor kinase
VSAGPGLGLPDPERENALLIGIIEAISAGPALEPLATRVAGLIVEATGTDVCFVHVLDDGGGALTLTGATPPFDSQVGRIRLPVGEGVSGWVASHHEPAVLASGKEADPRYRYFPELSGQDYTSMVSVPMESRPTGLVGVLNVHTRQRRDFTDRDVRLLGSIGTLVAGAVHQARLHRRLAAREQAAERFAEQVIAAQEAERRRLAGDIHDGITQRLVSLAYHLDAAADAVRGGTLAAAELARARELTDLTLDEAHAAIAGLRPPVLEDLGLADGLASLARSVGQLRVRVVTSDCRLPEHMEIALYRIAQEALQNVVKHARAGHAEVELRCDDSRALLRVTDDGQGFDLGARSADENSYGLRSMTERAELMGGRLTVTSRPGLGTTVTASVPMRPATALRQRVAVRVRRAVAAAQRRQVAGHPVGEGPLAVAGAAGVAAPRGQRGIDQRAPEREGQRPRGRQSPQRGQVRGRGVRRLPAGQESDARDLLGNKPDERAHGLRRDLVRRQDVAR